MVLLQLKSTLSTEDAEICIVGINHMESTLLAVSGNSILNSYLYSI